MRTRNSPTLRYSETNLETSDFILNDKFSSARFTDRDEFNRDVSPRYTYLSIGLTRVKHLAARFIRHTQIDISVSVLSLVPLPLLSLSLTSLSLRYKETRKESKRGGGGCAHRNARCCRDATRKINKRTTGSYGGCPRRL